MLIAANRTGKTFSAAWEVALHATGEYYRFDWWDGVRFKKAPLIWVGSITNETNRDIVQKELLGEPVGTGLIPGESIIKVSTRQAGVSNVADMVTVRHRTGTSQIVFKCHPAGEMVWMSDGTWKAIEDVQVGEYVVCADNVTRRATQKHLYENAPVIELVTNCGEIRGTPNHPVFTQRGKIRMDEVVPGDVLETAHPETGVERSDWAFLVGFLIGDGCFRGKTPTFTCANDHVMQRVLAELPDDLVVKHISRYDYKISSVLPNRNRLTDLLRSSGLWGKKSDSKRIPDWAYRLVREDRIEFLRGLWAADGTMAAREARYSSCSRDLCEDVRRLLWSVGIEAPVKKQRERAYYVYISRENRKLFDEIGKVGVTQPPFGKTKNLAPFGTVKEIRELPNQDVYGIGIPDVHELIVGGFRTGNTYDQGWRKFQGTQPEFIWLDEEPEDYRVYTECLTRILTSKGRISVTFTPLLGETDLVLHFNEGLKGTYLQTATWDDAPHLSEEDKERFAASYPAHERDARTKGVPMMGEGRLFPFPEEDIKCDPFEIPAHYARIGGIDFGIDHPGAGAWLAWDRDSDILYVYDCYKKSGQSATFHAEAVKRRGDWIPISWPHDGVNKEKGSGQQLQDIWRAHGVNLLGMSARYKKEKGGAQPVEPIVMELYERIETGRFKVFSHLTDWFSEYRNLHRKDGRIVPIRDDIFKATCYAAMMRRYATQQHITPVRGYMKAVV